MDFSAIKTLIEQNIRTNNNEDITGSVLQNVLLGIIETLGDDAINDLITALGQEVNNRQNAVQGEADARSQADNTILGKIANILNGGYLYQGIAGVATNPGNPTVSCFYFAKGAGTYTNFRNGDNDPIVITDNGLYALTYEAVENEYWEYNKITDLDDGVFDISRYHASGGTLATYADLSAALGTNGANVPAAFRKGGMSIKFVHTSDNNYVKWMYMLSSTTNANFANVANWQGVDEEPKPDNDNLAKGKGIAEYIGEKSFPKTILQYDGYYASNVNGKITASALGAKTTALIPFTKGDILVATNLMNAGNYEPVAMYDSNKDFIVDGYTATGSLQNVTLNENNTPEDCAFVRLNTNRYDIIVTLNGTPIDYNSFMHYNNERNSLIDENIANLNSNNGKLRTSVKTVATGVKGDIIAFPIAQYPLNTKVKFRVNDSSGYITNYAFITDRGNDCEKGTHSDYYRFLPNTTYIVETKSSAPTGDTFRLFYSATGAVSSGTISCEFFLEYENTQEESIDELEKEQVEQEERIEEVEEMLSDVDTEVSLPNTGYYKTEDGTIVPYSPYIYTDLIDLRIYDISYEGRTQGIACLAFFDKNKNYIGYVQTVEGESHKFVYGGNNIPVGSVYIGICASTNEAYHVVKSTNILKQIQGELSGMENPVYHNIKLCTIGSSSTYPCKWQRSFSDWNELAFSEKETQTGNGYVRIAGASSYWLGLEWADELPSNVTQTTIDVSVAGDGSSTIDGWIDGNGQLWRKAFQLANSGDNIKAGLGLNIFARAFDIQFYQPKVVMFMCYNEINYITTTSPYGSLGTVNDAPATSPNVSASVLASYKAVIDHILRTCPECEIYLITAKLNTYKVYGINSADDVDMATIHNSERYKKDDIYANALHELADYYNIKCIDLLHNTGFNPYTVVPFMIDLTNVHCNDKGYLMYFANLINKQFNS